ncbi:MAG TPA: phospholipase D-like domain-containing protein [Nostoc sp.]|uniref:phospholipase D-like domain-containing protein n=1 Tax=Nostoc sp. TaxID=1180 RepID=UPI002D644C7A|nr:phospholipase D-like domain-containing protein [Nostoc sp.]HYX19040.1 phospholipase D-like domain-containing protein [Nostoc sp.]
MFLASSAKPIDENLKKLVDEIETQSPNLSVLAAREFRYSLRQTQVEVNIKEPRQFNVLEEFIIRAAIEFQPPPTEDELASVLGLDSVFIKTTTTTLRSLQTLSPTSPLTVTPEGRSFYEKGSVPQPPYPIQIYAITDPLSDKITFQSESLSETTINLPDLADFITIDHTIADIASLPLEEIQKSVQASVLALHVPEEGKIVTSYRVLASTQKIWRKISLFVIFDALEDKLTIQIRNGKQILESASNWLELLHTEGKISLQALCKLSTETIIFERQAILKQKNTEIESRLEKIRQKALDTSTKATREGDNYKALGEAVQLRDGQISLAFSEVLNSAKSQVLIYSPWVNQAVVNEKFLTLLQKLANRGVRILIGHGIARRQEDEDEPIPPEVEKKLRAIKTLDGLPSVQVFWLGDSHVKEVIVDKQIHLCGSHNWLSYRGDYLSRGESVYKVTIPHQVQEAYQFLANRFQNHAQKLWGNALEKQDSKLAIESLCVWGALGMEDIALKEIQKNNWFELLPVWLNVALQGLKSKNLAGESESFKTALSLLSQVSIEETFIEELQQSWCKVMGAIAINNPKTALNLLSDEVWAQFIRLSIAQNSDSPDKFISQYT